MRILCCSENYPPSVGGVQEVSRQIAERLAARGHSVTVATSNFAHEPAYSVRNHVNVHRFNVSGNYVRGLSGDIRGYSDFVSAGNFDAILINAAQQWTLDALLERHTLTNIYLIPCGFSQLENPSYQQYFSLLSGKLKDMAGLIFCTRNYSDYEFAIHHGATRCHIIPNGADAGEFDAAFADSFRSEFSIPQSTRLIISVGTQIASKGHWEVLRAYSRADLACPSVLAINAHFPYNSAVGTAKELIKNLATCRLPLPLECLIHSALNSKKKVLLLDLPREELVSLYKAADLFAFGSHREYSPLVIHEALAAGVPFISTPAGNAAELAEASEAGVIVDAKRRSNGDLTASISSMARLMAELINSPAKLSAMKMNARRAFNEQYTWGAITDQYERLLLEGPNAVK